MNIVIPMSGTGSRFAAKGYKEIKPLVPVFGKPIIKYIIDKFSSDDNFIFICREEHLLNKKLDLKNYLNSLAPNTTVLSIENHKLGPVHSLIQIEKHLDINEELIVNYCDFDWRWDYNEFKKWLLIEKPKAALCVYSGFHPHYINPAPYAYTRNNQNHVLEIKEKESFTNYREEETAASGTFYFSSASLLLDACKWLVKKDENINGEYYVSLLFNYFPLKGLRTLIYSIKYFMQWGTPQDLEEYIFFGKKIPLNFKKRKINCPLIILMAGKGNRMKSINDIKKPYLEINKSNLFQICTQNFMSKKNNICAINGDIEDEKNAESFLDLKRVIVGQTASSVETLYLALQKSELPDSEEVFIMPCDAAIDFDWDERFNQFKNNKEVEAIIFSFSNYPHARWVPNQFGWLDLNKDDSVRKVGYKKGWNQDFSNPIVSGYFWFPNVGRLKTDLELFLETINATTKEPSIDEFCGFLIKNNKKVFSYNVKDFLCLGTYQEFRAYEYWLNANEISTLN